MEGADRNKNVIVGLVGLLLVFILIGTWWVLRRDERAEQPLRQTSQWILFERDGGFVGHGDNLALSEDGHAVLRSIDNESPIRYEVPAPLMTKVHTALSGADWSDARQPPLAPSGADLIFLTIRHEGHIAYTNGFVGTRSLKPLFDALLEVLESAPQRAAQN